MLFTAPILASGAGAIIRPMVEWAQGTRTVRSMFLAPLVLGLVAVGISGVLFVTAQLTGAPDLAAADVAEYARRSIPYTVAIGFVAGLTSDAVFGRVQEAEIAYFVEGSSGDIVVLVRVLVSMLLISKIFLRILRMAVFALSL